MHHARKSVRTFGSSYGAHRGYLHLCLVWVPIMSNPKRQRGPAPEESYSWATQGVRREGGGDPPGSSAPQPTEWSRQDARRVDTANTLLEYLIMLYAQCILSAKNLCIICYYLSLLMIPGDFRSYALAPGQKTDGNYKRKLDSALPRAHRPQDFYSLKVPSKDNRGKRS